MDDKNIELMKKIAEEEKSNASENENKYLKRVNELARLAKERELTPEEQKERAEVRKLYLEEFRKSMKAVLDNTYVKYPNGTKVKLERKFKN